MNYSYISNSCSAIVLYRYFNKVYDQPFIGSLFVNDEQYVKFCENFDHYIKVEPRFGLPTCTSTWAQQNISGWYREYSVKKPYPVMYLDDIEIHWLHEHSEQELLKKYKRRRDRLQTPFFFWSISEMFNDHTSHEQKELISRFNRVKNSIFLTNNPEEKGILVNEWVTKLPIRSYYHVYNFNDQPLIGTYVYQYITGKDPDYVGNDKDLEN